MKSSEFFLKKANEYISELDSIISGYTEFDINSRLSFSNDTTCAVQ